MENLSEISTRQVLHFERKDSSNKSFNLEKRICYIEKRWEIGFVAIFLQVKQLRLKNIGQYFHTGS